MVMVTTMVTTVTTRVYNRWSSTLRTLGYNSQCAPKSTLPPWGLEPNTLGDLCQVLNACIDNHKEDTRSCVNGRHLRTALCNFSFHVILPYGERPWQQHTWQDSKSMSWHEFMLDCWYWQIWCYRHPPLGISVVTVVTAVVTIVVTAYFLRSDRSDR